MNSPIFRFVLVPALLGATGAAAQIPASPHAIIVPHRAVYDIGLMRSEDSSGVTSASGRMVFEITGNSCLGYTMRQRMVVNISNEEGEVNRLDFRIRTFESGEGDLYTFDSQTSMDEDLIEAVAGEARRVDSAIEVTLTEPAAKTLSLDDETLFPSQHLQAIIGAAAANRKFLAAELYEGSGSGEASDSVTAAIGPLEDSVTAGELRDGVRHWPISVGYFDGQGGEEDEMLGEELPTYQIQFTLYENGITNDLVMDYGDYALSGALQDIEPLTNAECPSP